MTATTILLDTPPECLSTRLHQIGKRLPWLIRVYVSSFFPIFQWIHRYNLSWLLQDMIAGITVGIVLVPQCLSYAKIAGLEPQYGLYTSFVGVSIYCFFGTSKDISIGMISTVCLLVGQAIINVKTLYPDITGPQIAVNLSLMTGLINLILGISRLGILVDFIPQPAIAAYMTGSAITITIGQWPKLFGLNSVNTHDPPYLIVINFFKNITQTRLDVAFGLTGLIFLYMIRSVCHHLSTRYDLSGIAQKAVFYSSILRNGLLVVMATLISYFMNRGRDQTDISIIRNVPEGFDAMAVPVLDSRILSATSSLLPSIIIIMILEHISVAKAFGRVYDYKIDSNQEIFTIGVCNILGSFFGGAPATGAFSRTAIMAKSGVRTPAGGIFSGLVVICSLYVLTPCFYYIPDAILSAVVIHAVADLVTSPRYLKQLFDTSLLELFVWIVGVLITICIGVQTGIYAAVGLSLVIMLFRMARPPVKLLGRIPLSSSSSQQQYDDGEQQLLIDRKQSSPTHRQRYIYLDERDLHCAKQNDPLPPGLLVFQLTESILYPNAEFVTETIISSVKSRTRCGNTDEAAAHQIPWNHQININTELHRLQRPILRALVLDLTSSRRLDSSALSALMNLRNNVNKYSGQDVEWHFVGIQSAQLRQDLIYHGFGLEHQDTQTSMGDEKHENRQQHSAIVMSLDEDLEIGTAQMQQQQQDLDRPINNTQGKRRLICLDKSSHRKYSYYHWDVDAAVNSIWKRWNTTTDHS
ncbi:sulfate transporter family-domain-containing protein [Chlamydoabsidia padenii]|nr:sulfate transporter family-domain-containing protein [Chlamydoabsidia padenii]